MGQGGGGLHSGTVKCPSIRNAGFSGTVIVKLLFKDGFTMHSASGMIPLCHDQKKEKVKRNDSDCCVCVCVWVKTCHSCI